MFFRIGLKHTSLLTFTLLVRYHHSRQLTHKMTTNFFHNSPFIQNDVIRTDVILENTFSYLLGNSCEFKTVERVNEREKNIFNYLKMVINSFRENTSSMKFLCEEMIENKITENTVDSNLLNIANELFSDGISWSRIIAFSVFVGELTVICTKSGSPKSIVQAVYESYSRIVKEKLETWITDHNGWENILTLTISNQEDLTKQYRIKHACYNIIRITGTLSSIANIFQNNF